MCEVWALGKSGCHRGTWQTSKWLQRAERSEAVSEGVQPKTRRDWTRTKRGTNAGYVMSWHWPSRKQMDLAMRRNSSGDKTEETWKAGERADGIRLASQRWQSLSVSLSSIKAQTETLFYCLGTRFSIWQIITFHPGLQWVSLTQLVILKRTAKLGGRPRKRHI